MDSFIFNAVEYNKETVRLTTTEEGIYWRLLRRYLQTEEPLDNDIVFLSRKIGIKTKSEKNSLQMLLEKFFMLDPGMACWRHERCDTQIAELMIRKNKRAAAANIRWDAARSPKTIKPSKRKSTVSPAGRNGSPHPITVTPSQSKAPASTQQVILDLDDALSDLDRTALPATDTSAYLGDYNLNDSDKQPFALPEWIDPELWDAFLEMRKKKKAAPTERAKKMLVERLADFMEKGYSPSEVIKESTMNGWTGFWEPKDGQGLIKNENKITNKTDFSKVNYGDGGRL